MEAKIKVYANLSMVYARLNENKQMFDEVMRVCDSILLTPITPQTRKNVNAMKARVQGKHIIIQGIPTKLWRQYPTKKEDWRSNKRVVIALSLTWFNN